MAITFDSASSSTSTGTSLTFSHTVGTGDDRLLVVAVTIEDSEQDLATGVTYNGDALTNIRQDVHTGDWNTSELWYLLAPDTGTHDVVISFGGTPVVDIQGGAASFFGVEQQAPEVDGSAETSSSTNINVTLNVVTANSLIVDAVSCGIPTDFTADETDTKMYEEDDSSSSGAMGRTMASSTGNKVVGYDATGSVNRLIISAAAFAPAAGAAGTNFQMNIGDSWKSVDALQINIGDSWKSVEGVQVNIGDAWKTIF